NRLRAGGRADAARESERRESEPSSIRPKRNKICNSLSQPRTERSGVSGPETLRTVEKRVTRGARSGSEGDAARGTPGVAPRCRSFKLRSGVDAEPEASAKATRKRHCSPSLCRFRATPPVPASPSLTLQAPRAFEAFLKSATS